MESRKVQQVGGGTYTVSLPKEWAETAGVGAGSMVDIHTHIDGVLVIEAGEPAYGTGTPAVIAVTGDGTACVERALRAAYAAGVSEVRLRADDAFTDAQRRAVERVARTLTGMTVAAIDDGTATVRTLLDAEEVSIRQSVRQLQFVVLSTHREATAALTGDGTVENPDERDEQADRIHAIVDRYFQRAMHRLDEVDALGLTRGELFALWVTARELERVGDHAERIARVASQDPSLAEPTTGDLTDLADRARGVVEDGVRTVLGDAGVEPARRALDTRDELRDVAARLDRDLFDGDAPYEVTRALDSIRRTAEHGGNVAEFSLRMAVRDGALADDGPDDR